MVGLSFLPFTVTSLIFSKDFHKKTKTRQKQDLGWRLLPTFYETFSYSLGWPSAIQTEIILNFWSPSSCLHFPNSGVIAMCHHTWFWDGMQASCMLAKYLSTKLHPQLESSKMHILLSVNPALFCKGSVSFLSLRPWTGQGCCSRQGLPISFKNWGNRWHSVVFLGTGLAF